MFAFTVTLPRLLQIERSFLATSVQTIGTLTAFRILWQRNQEQVDSGNVLYMSMTFFYSCQLSLLPRIVSGKSKVQLLFDLLFHEVSETMATSKLTTRQAMMRNWPSSKSSESTTKFTSYQSKALSWILFPSEYNYLSFGIFTNTLIGSEEMVEETCPGCSHENGQLQNTTGINKVSRNSKRPSTLLLLRTRFQLLVIRIV